MGATGRAKALRRKRTVTVSLVCRTEGCPRELSVVNTVTMPAHDLDLWLESYGQGSEDADTDECPACGVLLTAELPLDDNHKIRR